MEQSLAYEMLGELKRANKRIFIITIVEFIIIVSMIIGFFIYESQFNYGVETNQTIEDTQNSTINQVLGGEDESNNNS